MVVTPASVPNDRHAPPAEDGVDGSRPSVSDDADDDADDGARASPLSEGAATPPFNDADADEGMREGARGDSGGIVADSEAERCEPSSCASTHAREECGNAAGAAADTDGGRRASVDGVRARAGAAGSGCRSGPAGELDEGLPTHHLAISESRSPPPPPPPPPDSLPPFAMARASAAGVGGFLDVVPAEAGDEMSVRAAQLAPALGERSAQPKERSASFVFVDPLVCPRCAGVLRRTVAPAEYPLSTP